MRKPKSIDFKTLDEVIAEESPGVQARIKVTGDKLAAKRDAAVRFAKGDAKLPVPKRRAKNAQHSHATYPRDDGPLTVAQIAEMRDLAQSQLPKGKVLRVRSSLRDPKRRPLYKLASLMAEMANGLPRVEGWDSIPARSNHAEQMSQLLQRSFSVFGSKTKALQWLLAPKQRFDGRTPLEVAEESSTGAKVVLQMIEQIDEGFFG